MNTADLDFGGVAPDDDDRADMLRQIIDATSAYAAAARERMGLHPSKRIAVAVPVDVLKRPLFEQVEAALWDMAIRLDWSGYTTWQVPHSLAEGFEPLDMVGYRRNSSANGVQGAWKVTPRAQRMPLSITAQEARAFAARLLAAADACDEQNRQMPATAEPVAGAFAQGSLIDTDSFLGRG